MIMDFEGLLTAKTGQDLTALNDSTIVSTHAIDTNPNEVAGGGGTLGRNIGGAPTINLFAQVLVAFTVGTSVNIQVIQDDDADLGDGPDVIVASGVVLIASLVIGKAFQFILQPDSITKRYLGMQFVGAGNMGAGTIVAGVIWDLQTNFSDWPAITGYENI